MLRVRFLRKVTLALLTTSALAGGTVFTSCGPTDIRDNLLAGALAGVKGAATNWIDGLLPDFNEFVGAIPKTPVINP